MDKNQIMKKIEARPNTILRTLAICALSSKGYVGPNYNLDDVSATIMIIDNCFHISFWDMDCIIDESNSFYNEIENNIKKFEKLAMIRKIEENCGFAKFKVDSKSNESELDEVLRFCVSTCDSFVTYYQPEIENLLNED